MCFFKIQIPEISFLTIFNRIFIVFYLILKRCQYYLTWAQKYVPYSKQNDLFFTENIFELPLVKVFTFFSRLNCHRLVLVALSSSKYQSLINHRLFKLCNYHSFKNIHIILDHSFFKKWIKNKICKITIT